MVLAGGTQMAAVLCAADALGLEGDVSIATTRYIVEDRNASFVETVETLGRSWYMADPGLDRSKMPPLSCYARGAPRRGSGPAEPSWRPASGASPNRRSWRRRTGSF